jgi:ATP-dependent Lon protease
MFITTANLTDPIPSALRDRMEIIEIAGYSDEEKLKIARAYLWPRQVREHGLKPDQVSITRETLLKIINEYTGEAGLRGLEKEIGAICRKIARQVAEGKKGPFRVTRTNLHRFLGAPVYLPDEIRKEHEIGVATGLAWTSAGGEVLYVETTVMKGKGSLQLTGQLGEIMKESGQAALSYARSRSRQYRLKETDFDQWDIHIHVPAGAISKDGPSAGITMAVSLVSALTRIPVNKDVALTGEITLRGKILPIGGLKEKTLAAIRAKIKTILIPEQNRKDLEELPRSIRRRIQLIPVRDMDQVLEMALIRSPSKAHINTSGRKDRA